MKNITLVMWREFITQARKKSFIIITILAPLLILLAGVVIAYMLKVNDTGSKIAIIDSNHLFYSKFKSNTKDTYNFYEPSELESLKKTLLQNNSIDAILYIPKSKDSLFSDLNNKIELLTNKNLSKSLLLSIQKNIDEKIEEERRLKLGINESDIKKINSKTYINILNLKEGISDNTSSLKDGLSIFLMYVVLMFIIIYGTRVMRSVMEEKTNRVVEIIISSVKPFELMMGKILGTTLVALLQFSIWIMMTLILLFLGQIFLGKELMLSPQENDLQSILSHEAQMQIKFTIDSLLSLNYPLIIFIFLFFFFFGYLFYSSLLAAIGAAVDNETEVQQFMPIIVVPLLLGAYGCLSIINNPEGPIAFWLSIIPFTSPLVMVTRSFYGLSWLDILASVGVMILSVLFMTYIASKIYRVGILMYGKKVNIREIIKWIRQS